jgi:20S proteasome alpha/beta subunit
MPTRLQLVCFLLLHHFCVSSNQRRSYSTTRVSTKERYDRSVTTFDPTGRLFQVEYAQQATLRSLRNLLVMAIVVDDTTYVLTTSSSLPRSMESTHQSSPTTQFIHRISENIWLIGIGLVGDIRAVASHLRMQAQQHIYNYDEELTIKQAATIVSNLQHQLTFQAGVRPLGISCFVFGSDANQCSTNSLTFRKEFPTAQLFKCSPGGIQEDCLYSTAGFNEAAMLQILHQRYSQFNNTATEGDIVEGLVSAAQQALSNDSFRMNTRTSTDETDDATNQLLFDVWVFRTNGSTQHNSTTCRRNKSVTCFAGLCNSQESFAKMYEYYRNHSSPLTIHVDQSTS